MPALRKYQVGEPVTAEMINGIVDAIREAQLSSVVGGTYKRSSGGTTISINTPQKTVEGSIAEDNFPFKISFPTVTGCKFQAGVINGLLPSNYDATLTIPAVTPSYVRYIVVKGTTDGKTISTAELAVETTAPLGSTAINAAPTTYSCLIYVIASGEPYRTIGKSSILGIPQEIMRTPAVPASALELPYTSTYQWLFAS
jgi:hypothetical protein